MKPQVKQRLAWNLYPRYSNLLEELNQNAKVRAWLKDLRNATELRDRSDLFRFINANLLADGPMDFLEFGVSQGASFREWMTLNTHALSRFFGFDSFRGLPENWTARVPRGSFAVSGTPDPPIDPRGRYIVGLFQEVLPDFLRSYSPANQLVLHFDSDLYSSTLYCLTATDAICRAGTLLIFDEFTHPLHEFRALDDYQTSYRRRFRAIGFSSLRGVPQQVAFVRC